MDTSEKISLPCAILAGGKSSRMGRDKALLPFMGFSTLAEYQYAKMASMFQRVAISAKDGTKFPFDAPVLEDQGEEFAPTVALKTLLENTEGPGLFVMAVDIPFVKEESIRRLTGAFDETVDAVVPATHDGQVHTLCGVYSVHLLPALEEAVARGKHKLKRLLEGANVRYLPFPDDGQFINLNRPHEYEEALKSLES